MQDKAEPFMYGASATGARISIENVGPPKKT